MIAETNSVSEKYSIDYNTIILTFQAVLTTVGEELLVFVACIGIFQFNH